MSQPPGLHFYVLKQKLGEKLEVGLQKKKINLNKQWEKTQSDNVAFSLLLTAQKIKYLFIFLTHGGKSAFCYYLLTHFYCVYVCLMTHALAHKQRL